MRNRNWTVLFVLALSLGIAGMVYANGADMTRFNAAYPSSPILSNCSVCHTSAPSLNSYGSAYLANGRSAGAITAIASLDSDGDGFSNLIEINAGTFPGNAASTPAPVADAASPTLAIASHTNGQTVTAASITLSGTATDSGRGNSGIQQVMVNGVAATGGTAATNATANWSRALTLNAGTNSITVIASDNSSAHNTTTQTLTITYNAPAADTMSPTVAVTSHTNGQTVTVASIALAGTATDSGRGNSGIQQVTVNGVAATGGTAATNATANWSRTLTLAAGTNTITVVASDNSPAHNPTTQGLTITYSAPAADTASPTLAVTSHTNGQTVTAASITLAGTATDSGRGNSGIQQVTVNGVAATGGTAATNATANWSRMLTLATGTNTITVVASDNSTAHNATSQTLTITYNAAVVDTTAPTLAVTSHTNGQTVTAASITLSGTATDSGRGNSGIQQVTVNGVTATGGTAATNATANWSRTLTLATGTNTITVVASDNSTAHNTMTQNLTINYNGGTTPPPPSSGDLPSFSRPTRVTNPYFPLATFGTHILEGTVGGQQIRVVRTLKDLTVNFKVGDQTVKTVVLEDRSYVDGELEEVALDYFAQADDGTVYYFGEDVDIYRNGKVVSHEGTWRYGIHTNQLGIIMPARPKVGTTYQAEKVPGITTKDDEVLSVSETVRVPAGKFRNCLNIQETLADGTLEFKYYAPKVGVIKEVTKGGSINLIAVGEPAERDED